MTNPINYNLNRWIKQTLYMLKRQYGGPISIYKLNEAETNYRTGRKGITKTVYNVNRAIILPVKVGRDAVKSISQISANKKFTSGGTFEKGVRDFIIDRSDVDSNLELTADDWIVYNGRRYNIKSIQEFEFGTAWIITGQEVMGAHPEQHYITASDHLLLTSQAATARFPIPVSVSSDLLLVQTAIGGLVRELDSASILALTQCANALRGIVYPVDAESQIVLSDLAVERPPLEKLSESILSLSQEADYRRSAGPSAVSGLALSSAVGRNIIVQKPVSSVLSLVSTGQGALVRPLTLNKVADPGTALPDLAKEIHFSPDSNYLAVAHHRSPFISAYNWSAGFGAKVADPGTPVPGDPVFSNAECCQFSPGGNYLAVAHSDSPYLTVYNWSAGFGAKVSDPAVPPDSVGICIAWSPDGAYLAVADGASPVLNIWEWSAGFGTKLGQPAVEPDAGVTEIRWSPDGAYLAVAQNGGRQVTVWNWSSGFGAKFTDPGTSVGANANALAWSPDGNYLLLALQTSPYVAAYSFSDGFVSRLSDPGVLPEGNATGVYFMPDGNHVALSLSASPYVAIYEWFNGFGARLSNPATLPAGLAHGLAFSGNNELAVAHNNSPYVTAYT